jgi:hypothetical protein
MDIGNNLEMDERINKADGSKCPVEKFGKKEGGIKNSHHNQLK